MGYNKDEEIKEEEPGYGADQGPGDPVPWLSSEKVKAEDGFPVDMVGNSKAIEVRYTTVWPDEVPILKAGETLTFAGGEYRADPGGPAHGPGMGRGAGGF